MKRKRYRSIIHEVIILPLIVMVFISTITIISSMISYQKMEEKLVDGNINSMKIAMSQIDNLILQLDKDFIHYVTDSESYIFMHTFDETTPKSRYFRYEAQTADWLSEFASRYTDISGAFAYYENMNLLLFRGSASTTQMAIHDYIKDHLKNNDLHYNQLDLINISNSYYLLYIKKYGEFYGGCWIPAKSLIKNLGLTKNNLIGSAYLMDSSLQNTLPDATWNTGVQASELLKKRVTIAGEKYSNYCVLSSKEDFYLGILILNDSLLLHLPLMYRIIFGIVILSVFMVPFLLFWLQRRIARPLKELDKAMKIIGNGDREYRLSIKKFNDENEFTKLMERFNQMMDEMGNLEINLYQTKIREQKTKLKYISQQIRPHFILNALNLIYTYEVSEFDLAKRMVLYLTKYFRYIVNLQVDFVELEMDFHHVETYLQIQKERYLDRLDYVVEWEKQVSHALVPPLIIQTFVENCIKYAMKNDGKLFIFVLAHEVDGKLKISIKDTGSGFREDTLQKIQHFIQTREYRKDLGIGIQNAIERMDVLYQQKVEIDINNAPTGGTVVELLLPMQGNQMEDT